MRRRRHYDPRAVLLMPPAFFVLGISYWLITGRLW